MARTDANPPMPEFRDEYALVEVDADYLAKAVKPKQFIHIDQSECIMCEGCVDICPWKCIHMVDADGDRRGDQHRAARATIPSDHVVFIIDDDVCTRCALCVDRCPTGVIILGKVGVARPRRRPAPRDEQPRLRLRHAVLGEHRGQDIDDKPGRGEGRTRRPRRWSPRCRARQAWNSIFRPGSIFRKGYTDSPRNRSYVIMNSVLYHLHPVKVKRHAVKVSYTLCLGGLSFFLFILLTVTGIFLMFFYRPDHRAGLERHLHAADVGDVRPAGAQHAPMGRAPHGAVGVPAHGRASSTTAPTSRPASSTG